MLASSPTKTHIHEGPTNKGSCTSESHKCPVNRGVFNNFSYKNSIRHIANHRVKVNECPINADFAHSQVQTNDNNTESFGSR